MIRALKESIGEELAERLLSVGTVFVVKSGSHAYGTNTPESDVDIRGVYVPELRDVIDGFQTAKAIDFTDGDVDVVLQPVNKFLKLCSHANPNILDWLFVPEGCVLFVTKLFQDLILTCRDSFLTKALYARFRGYAVSHGAKMVSGGTRELGAKRKKDIEKFGFSTKNAMHLIRLLRMAIEALRGEGYNVRRADAEELLSIRRGEWSLEKVEAERDKLIAELSDAMKASSLPGKMDTDLVADLAVRFILAHDRPRWLTL